MNIDYRGPEASDTAFIMKSWLDGQRHQGDRSLMTNNVYYVNEKKRLEDLLKKSHVTILCNPDDANQIFGYLVYSLVSDLFIIHYAHVKSLYRRLGIMQKLIRELYPRAGRDEIAITHINPVAAGLRAKYRLKYNPFLEHIL